MNKTITFPLKYTQSNFNLVLTEKALKQIKTSKFIFWDKET